MMTLQWKVNLSDRVKDAMRRHAAQTLLAGVARIPQCPRRTP